MAVPIRPRSACTARSIVQSAAETPSHLDGQIARTDAGPVARRAGHRRDHRDPAVARVYLEPDPAGVAGRALLEARVIPAGQQRGVPVVKLLEQAVDGAVVELALGQRVDVVVADAGAHLLEQPAPSLTPRR